jgi:hypothetical protein
VKSSTGGSAFIGYRFDPVLAVEVRYEGFNGFDLQGRTGWGRLDGGAVTCSGKAYPIKGKIQPFVGVGVGALFVKRKFVFNDGSRIRARTPMLCSESRRASTIG